MLLEILISAVLSSPDTVLTPAVAVAAKQVVRLEELPSPVTLVDQVEMRRYGIDSPKSAAIVIYRIKFVPAMPVTIDVSIPGISVQGDAFSCDNVIPWALGGEYPIYTVHNLKGTVAGETLSFSLLFGDYPTRFTGRLERE